VTGPKPEFEEIMRRLRGRTPEELVVMAARTELAIAESVILEERSLPGWDDDALNRLAEDLKRGE